MKRYFGAFVLLCALAMLIFRKDFLAGAQCGVQFCINTLAPAVFPFSVLCSLYAESTFCYSVGKALYPLNKRLFSISYSGGGILFMSLLCPSPVCVYEICDMYRKKQICKSNAELLCSYTSGMSPSLIIGFAGAFLFSSALKGAVIYGVCVFSSLLYGITLRKKMIYEPQNTVKQTEMLSFPLRVKSAVSSCACVCAYTVLFFTLKGGIEGIFSSDGFLLYLIAEPVTGIYLAKKASYLISERWLFSLVCASVSFTGICTCLSVFSACRQHGISPLPFFKGKVAQSVMSLAISYLVYGFF